VAEEFWRDIMSKRKWFHTDAKGVNADINRHRAKELKLKAKIDELESIETPNDFESRALLVYRGFLNQLLSSKAEVVSKLGTRK
jgi:hypothetical protein